MSTRRQVGRLETVNSCTCLFFSSTHSACKHMYIIARRLGYNVKETVLVAPALPTVVKAAIGVSTSKPPRVEAPKKVTLVLAGADVYVPILGQAHSAVQELRPARAASSVSGVSHCCHLTPLLWSASD